MAILFTLSVSLLICFIVVIFTVRYIRRKHSAEQGKSVQDVNVYKDDFDIIINISTVALGLTTFITSVVSIHVMLSQDKTQKMLVEYQQAENQPIFKVDIKAFPFEEGGNNDYEEYTITNEGKNILSPASEISCKSFIEIVYRDADIEYLQYYPLASYFSFSYETKNLTGKLKESIGGKYNHNLSRFIELSRVYSDVHLRLVHYFTIKYTDIYGVQHTTYFENEDLSSEEALEKAINSSTIFGHNTKPIDEVTIEEIVSDLMARLTSRSDK